MRVFHLLRGSLLLAMLLTSAALPSNAQTAAPASGMTQDAGIKLHYLDFGGQGTPVLLLPGMSNTAWIYSDFGRELAKRYRVFALTRRGHGQSDQPPQGYSLEILSNDILDFLNRQKIDRVVLVGHSLAGAELTDFATRHGNRVAALVYLDAAYDREYQLTLPAEPVEPQAMTDADRVSADSFVAYLRQSRGDIRRYWSETVERDMRASVTPTSDGKYRWTIAPIFEEYLKATSGAAPDYNRIAAPALAIYSVEDETRRLPPTASQADIDAVAAYAAGPLTEWREKSIAQFRKGPGSREVTIIDAGHHMFLHRPAETRRLLEEFLSRHGL